MARRQRHSYMAGDTVVSRDGHPARIVTLYWEDGTAYALLQYLDGYVPHPGGHVTQLGDGTPLWEHRVLDGKVVRAGGDYWNDADWEIERGLRRPDSTPEFDAAPAQLPVYRLPRVFYADHVARDLPEEGTTRVVRETGRHVYVAMDAAALADLRSDARYYTDPAIAADMGLVGLASSARATLKALDAGPTSTDPAGHSTPPCPTGSAGENAPRRSPHNPTPQEANTMASKPSTRTRKPAATAAKPTPTVDLAGELADALKVAVKATFKWSPTGSYAAVKVGTRTIGYVWKATRNGIRVQARLTKAPTGARGWKANPKSTTYAIQGTFDQAGLQHAVAGLTAAATAAPAKAPAKAARKATSKGAAQAAPAPEATEAPAAEAAAQA